MSEVNIKVFPTSSIGEQEFWPQLHAVINEAYAPTREDWPLPKGFLRLPVDPREGAQQLAYNFGPEGFIAVAFAAETESVLACAGLLPYNEAEHRAQIRERGGLSNPELLNTAVDETSDQWELNCVVTRPQNRGSGYASSVIGVLEKEARRRKKMPMNRIRMVVRTIDELSGPFWRRVGYCELEGLKMVLPIGFSHLQGGEGLQRELAMWYGDKWLD